MPVVTRLEKKRKLEERADEEPERHNTDCPICYEELNEDRELSCPLGHFVCFSCARKLVKPSPRFSAIQSGLVWTCPICRGRCGLGMLQMLALTKGSFQEASDLFRSGSHATVWQRNIFECSCGSEH